MSDRNGAVAELVGAHLVTSEPSAKLWHRVALGELSPEDAEAELLAGRQDVDEREREELERAKQVFEPPTEERRAAVLEALLERRADSTEGKSIAKDPSTRESVMVVPLRPRRTRRWVVGLCAAAAAVVLTVLIIRPPGARDPFPGGYEVEFEHVTTTIRGSEEPVGVPTFSSGGKIGIRLVPEEAVAGPVGAAVYTWDREGRGQALTVAPTVHDNGVVEVITTVKELGLRDGEWEIVVAIGWADALPRSWEDVVAAEGTKGVQVVRTRIRVVAG